MILEVDVYLVPNSTDDLGLKQEENNLVTVSMILDMQHVLGFREAIHDDGEVDESSIVLYTETGDFVIQHNYKEFKSLFFKYRGLTEEEIPKTNELDL